VVYEEDAEDGGGFAHEEVEGAGHGGVCLPMFINVH